MVERMTFPTFDYRSLGVPQDEWADCETDVLCYGNVYLRRDENGVPHRVSPAVVRAEHERIVERIRQIPPRP